MATYQCEICQQETNEIVIRNGHEVCESCWAKIRDYAHKVESRIERLQNRAERTQNEAQADWNRAREMASFIPMGQPVLLDHYSAKRDLAYRARIDRIERRAFDKFNKAADLARRAGTAEHNRAISSDDPAAIIKLQEKIGEAEKRQAEMVRLNKLVRKVVGKQPKRNPTLLVGPVAEINARAKTEDKRIHAIVDNYVNLAPELAKLAGISETLAAELLTPDFMGRVGIPDYATKNNGANIRRMKERLEELRTRAVKVATSESMATEEKNGVEIERNLEENRLRLHFPGKPAPAIITELKSRGFKWSPSNMAWQTYLSNRAEWHVECILKMLEPAPVIEPKPNGMVANVYHNGKHSRLNIAVADLQELIYRCGWTVVENIEGLTDEARTEIERLGALDWLESAELGLAWWSARLISETPALTPDI